MIDLSKKYNRNSFYDFLGFFLPKDFKRTNDNYELSSLNDLFSDAILIGKVPSFDNLPIFEILRKNPEKSRSKITKELFKFVEIHGFKNAIIITHSENENHYRLSLIVSNLEWINEKRVRRSFSNPKRLSFMLGENAKIHTANLQLIKSGRLKDFDDLVSRFNIEILNKEFFQNYKNLYLRLKKYLLNDKEFKSFSIEKNIEISFFSKRLLGQIIFCYFLQKKGWLGVYDKKTFGTGDKNFLRNSFLIYLKNKKNFFNDFIEFFFYEGLNKKNKNNFSEKLKIKIPYIGGGLFEFYEGYDWKKEKLNIPNSLFSNPKNDGILDIFDLYSFTVDESDPLDVEMSIDPEMLGNVFESLLDENLRQSKGIFYTPKNLVNLICSESIINYLEKSLDFKLEKKTISKFIKDENFNIKSSNVELHASKIDALLENIKICDPAIGSGAFAVFLLNLISKLRFKLSQYVKRKYKNTIYHFKKNCIQTSIFGVDIDASAVEITKLRLWLSLIVDQDTYDQNESLPNLDFKILQGNSLIENYEGYNLGPSINQLSKDQNLDLFTDGNNSIKLYTNELAKLQNEYFRSNSYSKKLELKKLINNLMIKILINCFEIGQKKINKKVLTEKLNNFFNGKVKKDFFPWGIFFADIFFNSNGFDLIVGNPPYIRQERIGDEKKRLSKNYKIFNNSADLYTYFFELSYSLLKPNGFLSLITSNKFTKAAYGKNLRNFLLDNFDFIYFVDFRKTKVFQSACVDTCISFLEKKNEFLKRNKVIYDLDLNFNKNLNQVSRKYLNQDYFTFIDDKFHEIKEKIEKKNLSECIKLNFYRGLVTGFKEAFIVDTSQKNKICFNDKHSESLFFKVLEGKNINKFSFNWSDLWLINTHNGNSFANEKKIDVKKDFPSIFNHLKEYKTELIKRYDKGDHWTNLRSCAYLNIFNKNRIIYSDISDSPQFTMCTKDFYNDNTVYNIDSESFAVLGLLNSSLFEFYYRIITNSFGGQTTRLFTQYIKKFPILKTILKYENDIKQLIDKIDLSKDINSENAFQKKINQIVFEVYAINSEDSILIEKLLKK